MAYDRDERGEAAPEVLTKTQARQGVTGHNVRYVLYWGLGGAAVAFALIYLVFFSR
jgi:hypothetical protein